MIWLIGILALIFITLCIILLSILVIEIDTRIPQAGIRWGTIGKARIWYDEEWWLSIQLLFYRKIFRMADIKNKPAKTKNEAKNKTKKTGRVKNILKRMSRTIKTFQVVEWKLAIDTGDTVRNAQLYPLNFFPKIYNHLFINFTNENFFVLRITNRPWKILYALFR